MEQTLIDIKDLSNIKFVSNYRNTDVLDLSRGNIYNINKTIFSETLSKFIKLDFGRNILIKNINLYGFSNNNIKYRIHNKLYGIPIYQLYYHESYDISYNILDGYSVSNIVLETRNITNLPNKILYYPNITDKLFYINNNNYHIKWSWLEDVTNNAVRYSTSLQEGVYDISGLNKQLNNLVFDIKYGPRNAFKNYYPLSLRGSKNYPNFTLSFNNSSNYSIIIYSDSTLFDFLTVNTGNFIIYSNSEYTIDFTYLPYSNEYLSISYNNTNIYDSYNIIYSNNNFFDRLPEKDHSGNHITYTEEDLTKEIYLERKTILDISDNTAIRVSQTRDENNMGIYTILGELSSNNIQTMFGLHDNSIIADISTNNIEIKNYMQTNYIDSSFIDTYNINIENDICGNNLKLLTNNIKVNYANFSDLDFSYNIINLYNSAKKFSLNKNKYKFIIFEFDNSYNKSIQFNNFRFNNIFRNNPLFRTYLLDNSNNYYRLGSINTSFNNLQEAVIDSTVADNSLNLTIPYIEDLSRIIFELEESQSRGLFFSYDPIDLDKIFTINDTNNCIYYEINDQSFIDISAVIRYKIPNGNYNLYELNSRISQQRTVDTLLVILKTDLSGNIRAYAGDSENTTDLALTQLHTIVDKYDNNSIPSNLVDISSTIKLFGEIIDVSLNTPFRSYEEYDKYTYNQNKLIFFVKNENLDFSYTILNNSDLSNSFFNYFFEKDISFITPSSLTNSDTKYFDLYNIQDISSGTNWDVQRDGDNIGISHSSDNIFAALLTVKNEFNNNLYFDMYYVNESKAIKMNDSGIFTQQKEEIFDVYSNINLKNFYFLKNTEEYITNYNNTIYYSISNNNTILSLDNCNLIYLDLNKNILIDNSTNIHENNNDLYFHDKLFIKELSCNEISYNTIDSFLTDFKFNNLYSEDVSNVKSINVKYNNNNIFNNKDNNIYLAYSNSNSILNNNIHSGNRMLITQPEFYNGWCIKMDAENKNLHSCNLQTLEFTSNFFNDVSSTWFNINASTLLSNTPPTSLNDNRFIYNSVSIGTVFNNIDIENSGRTENTLFPGPASHRIVSDNDLGSPPHFLEFDLVNNPAINQTYFIRDDISYNSVIQDVVLKLFPIKFKNNNTGFIETGYNLYDISNNIQKIKYLIKDGNIKGFSFNTLIPYICRTIQEISGALYTLEDKFRQAGRII